MRRKLVSLLLIICLLSTSITTFVFAQGSYDMVLLIGNPGALVRGAQKQIDPNNDNIVPFIVEGRTLVPLRFVAESFGADVGFEDETQVISIVLGDKVIYMQPDSPTYWVNDEELELDVAPMIFEGRTFVPFRKVAEIIGKYVSYDDGVIVLTNGEVDLSSEDFIAAKNTLLNGPEVSANFKMSLSKLSSELSPTNLSASSVSKVNPLAFYVGKVQREFGPETKLQTVNLDDYITDTTVKSANNDVNLNYKDGYLVIDTEKAQGVTGFMGNATKDLQDVKIDSKNEYASILVVSMDNQPINSSEKVLIQSMTEIKPLNYETELVTEGGVEKQRILNLGSDLMQVKDIEAVVTLKGITEGYLAVVDENGYAKEILEPVFNGGNLEITVPKYAIYILYSKTPISLPPVEEESGNFIWWEGEDFLDTNFPDKTKSPFDPVTSSGSDDFSILSESDWLSIGTGEGSNSFHWNNTMGDEKPYVKYEVDVHEDGNYSFYSRKFWQHGPFRWRFDDGEWTICPKEISLMDRVTIRQYLEANWVYLGEAELTAGTHVLEIELIQQETDVANGVFSAGFDAFLLTKESFVANGKVKPGQGDFNVEAGYFGFDPSYDRFTDFAALDLRSLNEEVAGQDGFIKADGENFIRPDGEKFRFWGVNTSYEIVNGDRNTIDYLAKSLAKRGVNLIRIHGSIFDVVDRKAVFKSRHIENLQYFIYAMKQAGIYSEISIYFPLWFTFGSETGYPEYDDINEVNPFALLQFEEDFQQAYKDSVKHLFETVNPHTGVALKDEPAVAFFEIQNEDNYFFWTFTPDRIPDVYLKQLEKIYGDWLIEKHGSLDNALAAWNNSTDSRDDFANGIAGLKGAWNMTTEGSAGAVKVRMADQLEFLTYHQTKFYADMTKYLKEDIGVNSLIIAGNWTTAEPSNLEALERYTYTATDVADSHGYFEPKVHESLEGTHGYSVNPGDKYVDRSALFIPDRVPLKYVMNANMPFIFSEVGWTNPNRFRAEFPVLIASYAALQGMDAPIFFTISPSFEKSVKKFTIYDPAVIGQFPATALIYRNGYVQETEPVVFESINLNDLYQFKGTFIDQSQNLDVIRQN